MISKDSAGVESRSIWVDRSCGENGVFRMPAFGLWWGNGGSCSCFLSYGCLGLCIVADCCFPVERGEYRFFGYPCGLPSDLERFG